MGLPAAVGVVVVQGEEGAGVEVGDVVFAGEVLGRPVGGVRGAVGEGLLLGVVAVGEGGGSEEEGEEEEEHWCSK